ncbi:MAG: SMEK domain-containing protein [Symploca sp. SIO2G7]|nr:SMEK domain-containing protein [Symploca sp. SIO2G7]
MHSLDIQNRINQLMSIFVTQVKGATSMGRTDINKVAENVLIPILSEIYGYTHLKNLNVTEEANYPAIDLGDERARVAIQVTSTTNSEKIKKTLRGFVKNEQYKKFDKLIVYILTEKQNTYSGKGYQDIIKNKFEFEPKKDVLDYRDLLKIISNFQIDKLSQILNILETNFGEKSTLISIIDKPRTTEKLHLNLLELSFPEKLYISDLAINREQVLKKPRLKKHKVKLNKNSKTRDVIRAALEQKELAFGVDWVVHEGRIITFHDLRNNDLPLSAIIAQKTTKIVGTQGFYKTDKNHENIFKSLLGRCLQQKLYQDNVIWQNKEKIFIFSCIDGAKIRKEKWFGKKGSTRIVYEQVMKNNKPDEIMYHKHFAFRTKYRRIGQNWYLVIVPDWFFSYDGYRHSFYAKNNLDWLKRKENDKNIYNHLRFILAFLKHEKPSDLFVTRNYYPFLSFGELIAFNDAPHLDDDLWNPKDSKNGSDQSNNLQLELPLGI